MAVTQNSYTHSGSTPYYPFTFPYLKASEVKVSIDATVTTAFTLANATTVQLNTAPASGAKIKIYRETDDSAMAATFYAGSAIKSEDLNDNFTQNLYTTQEVNARYLSNLGGTMVGDLTMGEDAEIIFEGATDNAHETKLTVTDPTADRVITLPNETGTVITTNSLNAVGHDMIIDGSIQNGDISNNAEILVSKLKDGNARQVIQTAANGTDVEWTDSLNLPGDLEVTGTTNLDGALDVDGVTELNSTLAVTGASTFSTINASAVTSTNGNFTMVDINGGTIDGVNFNGSIGNATPSVGTFTNLTVNGTTTLANSSINTNEIADDAIDSQHYAAGSIDLEHMSANSVDSDQYVDGSIDLVHMSANSVDSDQYVDGSIDLIHMSANSVDSDQYVDGSIDRVHLSADIIDATKIADDAVTTDHLADAELTTLAGMQSGTASILASGTALTATNSEINAICDGKTVQTTISDTDASYPTSGAVVDYVAAQIAPLGGLEVIANEVSFPNTAVAEGVVISISDAGGVVVDSNGNSTTARTLNGTTVTFEGFPSSLQSTTLAASIGLLVSKKAGSNQTYLYHKILGKEDDIKQLSDDINDFAARYRVASSAPSDSLDNGDLWYDTSNAKMMVYNATASAWEEVTSTGDFYINTISSYSGTGGNSATFNGSAYRFVLSNPPQAAQQLIVSVNGVLQKPNSGTGQPSEGFALNGSSIVFSAAPATSSPYFIITVGSTVAIGTPSDNTLSTTKIQNLAVTGDKVATNLDLADNKKIRFGTDNDLELYHNGTHNFITNAAGKVLYFYGDDFSFKNAAADETLLSFSNGYGVNLYYDNSKKFETTSTGVKYTGDFRADDDYRIKLGTSQELNIYHHNSGVSVIENTDQVLKLRAKAGEDGILINPDGSVDLYYDNSKKLDTNSTGVQIYGHLYIGDSSEIKIGNNDDLLIYHDGTNSWINNTTGALYLKTAASNAVLVLDNNNDTIFRAVDDGATELYYDNDLKAWTYASGLQVKSTTRIQGVAGGNATLLMYADDAGQAADYWKLSSEHVGNGFTIQSYASSSWETVFKGTDNRAAELHYQGSKKLETTSTGATITGNFVPESNDTWALGTGSLRWSSAHITALRIYTDGQWYDNAKATFGHGEDLQIYHDGTDSYISAGANGIGSYVYYLVNEGNNSDRLGMKIRCGADDASGTNYAITLADGDNTYQGAITFSGGTVTYGTFTAYHPCIVPDSDNPSDKSNAYPYGTLLETTSIEYSQKNGANTERGIRYKVQKTQSANSRKVLGAYGSSMNGGPEDQTNEHQALVLGDGHLLVNNAGGNIEVGDGICSSATAGIGQKATANPSMIIGIAQEAVTFTGSETKLVAVQYGLQQFIPWT